MREHSDGNGVVAPSIGRNLIPEHWQAPITGWLRWLKSDGRPNDSVAVRRTQITRLARERAGRDPWSLTTQDLAEWLAEHPSWTPSYRRAVRAAVRGFYAWARAVGLVDHDPASLLPRSRPGHYQPRPIPDDIVERAMSTASPRVQLMLELARDCGLRRAEIAAVHTTDVERHHGIDFLRVNGKGRRERLVPISASLAERIRERPTGWLFPSPHRASHLCTDRVGKLITAALPRPWTPHSLRHGYATAAYAVENDLVAVRDLLGHSSVSTTQVYVLAPTGAVLRAGTGARLHPAGVNVA